MKAAKAEVASAKPVNSVGQSSQAQGSKNARRHARRALKRKAGFEAKKAGQEKELVAGETLAPKLE